MRPLQAKKTAGCIGCSMRQRTIEKLDRVLSMGTIKEDHHVFLRWDPDKELLYDPSGRLFQHYVKDMGVYEQITIDPNVYSLGLVREFFQELSRHTLDEDTMRYYDGWCALFRCLTERKSFWCSVRLEEVFGMDEDAVLFRSEKRKKIFFHFKLC